MDFSFEPMKFVENLKYMGIGMLGVFMIVGIIMISTIALIKASEQITSKTEKKRDDEN